MAVIRRKELEGMTVEQRKAKIAELEKAILELRGEGRKDKVKPLKKAIAKLLTPPAKGQKTQPAPQAPKTQKPQTPPSKPAAAQPAPGAQHPASTHVGQSLGHAREAGVGPAPQPLKSTKTK